MDNFIPITLTEGTLGQRHRTLNYLVNKAFKSEVPFYNIKKKIEISPVDRLFKIDLASKWKDLDYILRNIKDEDQLYVSRALKSKWLLDITYQNIVNPIYLENSLFPCMVTTSVSKFKNWLYINLKDPRRCEEFYKYYNIKDDSYSMKFFSGCSIEFIVNEVEKILDKITPHQLKILCEKCPKVAEIYFANMATDKKLKTLFLDKEDEYFKSLKVVLKQDPNIFFNISEKYFNKKYNRSLTKYILNFHRHIFNRKMELYVTRLLHMNTVAQCLGAEECKEIVIKLAHANFLSDWFSYKNVEPLVKRLNVQERAEFKKLVFGNKKIKEEIEEWPYDLPALPNGEYSTYHVFNDIKQSPYMYECLDGTKTKKKLIKKRTIKKFKSAPMCTIYGPEKTYLDKLFEEYRFFSFGRTLFELRRRLKVESSSQNREYILLVLVSKSGGKAENLATLLELMSQLSNEPVHVRAAVVRSLVKRAAVWRLPQQNWRTFVTFAQGLGLDGGKPECSCDEGLHAVVLRNLLNIGTCEPKLRDLFIEKFTAFERYATTVAERKKLKICLPLLIQNAVDVVTDIERKAQLLELLLDIYETFKLAIDNSPLIHATKALAKCNLSISQNMLNRLFSKKIARRTLFQENFSFIQNDSSYLNALRHDTTVLDVNIFLNLIEDGSLCPFFFLRKISIYFCETGGLMETYLTQMKSRVQILTQPNMIMAKSMCFLLNSDVEYITSVNGKLKKHLSRFAADLRANMHVGRKKLDINLIDLQVLGAKAVANKVFICPDIEVDNYVNMLLNWKRTIRIGTLLSQRINREADAFAKAASIRPLSCLKSTILYFRHSGNNRFNLKVWDTVRCLLQNINVMKNNRQYLCNFISNIKDIPSSIKLEYCILLYRCLIDCFYYKALSILCHIELEFPNIQEDFIEEVLTNFLNEMNSDKYEKVNKECLLLHIRVLVKYLLIAKSEDIQKQRISVFAVKLFGNLEVLQNKESILFENIFNEILLTLQNNKIFFENTYVSPLPVMKTFVRWMQKHFAIDLYFSKYVFIHLTMLYCKAIQQCSVQMPNVFRHEKRKLTEGIEIVGKTFGGYIAQEVKILTLQYFNSITELYRYPLFQYFERYFQNDISTSKFIAAVIRGILENSTGTELKIGIYLLKDKWFDIGKELLNPLIDCIKEIDNKEIKFIFFAELHS